MIAPGVIEEVRRLLAENKLSQRKIARRVGICRGTVGKIAAGNRPDYHLLGSRGGESQQACGPPSRCPDCGGLVYPPCRLCRARRLAASLRPRRFPNRANMEPLGLQLKEEHRRRYEEVCAAQIARGPLEETP